MSERKAVNKYYPPDFNPLEAEEAARKMSKKLKTMNKDSVTIRLMTPFSMRCLKCSEFIPKSRKFNGKKELLPERYLDTIKQYRLSVKCPRCNNMISFRTDPKSGDYVMEIGGVKNFVAESRSSDSKRHETLDETLQRLEKQQQEEKDQSTNNENENKLEQIEMRLVKLQQEQEDYEALEALRKDNRAKMKRAELLHANDGNQSSADDKRAEEAFKAYNNDPAVKVESRASSHAENSAPSTSIAIQQGIRVKKKSRVNVLGVVKKRKNKT
ncbi:LADA_0G10814g1_1 [Lachancea dasiensis]|uniref:LADA_0G10814g1_1 n=1 Tax=Lachancea dasiensis TaxID=1072105 RepID=A0A1G4JUU0_9SACH|nr:LADA_0G10814g1_1 [Lachancea dasiensis]